MYLPNKENEFPTRGLIINFGALNRGLSIAENEFSDMENLSSDAFPLIGTRERRATVRNFATVKVNEGTESEYNVSNNNPTAFRCDGAWLYTSISRQGEKRLFLENSDIGHNSYVFGTVAEEYLNGNSSSLDEAVFSEAQNHRKIVTMGSKVIVFPEMYFVNMFPNSEGVIEKGFLYNKRYPLWKDGFSTDNRIRITPCSADGKTLDAQSVGPNPPEDPENGDVWLDTSGTASDYKMFDANTKIWNSIATTYMKIYCQGAFTGFRQWDTVWIDGFEAGAISEINNENGFENQINAGISAAEQTSGETFSDEERISFYEEAIEKTIGRLGINITAGADFEETISALEATLGSTFTEKQKAKMLAQYLESGDYKSMSINDNLINQIKGLNGKPYVLQQCTDDYIVVIGLIDAAVSFQRFNLKNSSNETIKEYGRFSFERRVPELDYYCECNNRIWGCKFGLDEDGNIVNHIMACKLGDPTNWYSYMGISTDSYDLSVGSDGPFTGCINFNGYPTFFKNKYIHKIYGSTPASFQMVTSSLRGVGKGMSDSMVICNNNLYYATVNDISVYDGASTYTISRPLGKLKYESCIAGTDQKKIYFVFTHKDGSKSMYVYDTEIGTWHREDCPDILFFANDGHVLYFIERYFDESKGCIRYRIKSVNESTNTVYIDSQWTYSDYPYLESSVSWWAETGDIGYSDPFGKYLQKISVRAAVDAGADYNIEISYDGQPFESITATNNSTGIKARDYVFRIKRCDYFKLRFYGTGNVTFISIYKSYVQGSDKK